jgi:hypothetical protein
VKYANATTASIKKALAHVGGGEPGQQRKFVVSVEDFNARVMSFFVEAYVLRHDAEVRVTLVSREAVAGGAEVVRRGSSSLYYEAKSVDSGYCDDGQNSLSWTMKNAFSEALAELVRAIESGKDGGPGGTTDTPVRDLKPPAPST